MNTADTPADIDHTAAALEAAATWLAEIGSSDEGTVVVVQAMPHFAVGAWAPGCNNIGMLAQPDDAAVELIKAVSPWMLGVRKHLSDGAAEALIGALERGAKLRALISPARQTCALRVDDGQDYTVLCEARLEQGQVH